MVIHTITSLDGYRELVRNHERVVVQFTADWCGPCKTIAPKLQELSEEFKNIHFTSANVDHSLDLCAEFNIKSIPSFIAVKNGNKNGHIVGGSYSSLRQIIEDLARP
ncbi:unnamed protein product [Blumeria hordei]|uniref:Thioredoxin n=2 Tax=Blumeria hordei TaxID=2867405 RepID=A0A383UZ00_BLUHO|nr:thioredoxin-like protein [Blumeria hordei DH14]SZF05594.1 unnamed protein product [Blumeria hordei]